MKWDYRVERFPLYTTKGKEPMVRVEDVELNDKAIQGSLQQLGTDGWELVGVSTFGAIDEIRGPRGVMLYLKRPRAS